MTSVAVVGDIHGDRENLELAIRWLRSNWSDKVVFVGDYVNRGADSKGVLALLLSYQKELAERVVFLLGNHEVSLMRFLDGSQASDFIAHGGLSTVASYLGSDLDVKPFDQFRRQFPEDHNSFLRGLVASYEQPGLLVTHAGVSPQAPASRHVPDLVQGQGLELFDPGFALQDALLVCGHYVQRDMVPFVSESLVCVDTGCGTVQGAPLTVFLWPSQEFVTFNKENR